MKPPGWFLSIDGQGVMGPHRLLIHGIAAAFCNYYVFNLEYLGFGATTLEFVQRYCIQFMDHHTQLHRKTHRARPVKNHVSKYSVTQNVLHY